MELQFYTDETGRKHIEKHNVTVEEIREALRDSNPRFVEPRRDGSCVAYCKLSSGRRIQIVFRKRRRDRYFIITAYDVEDPDIIRMLEEDTS